MEPVSPRKNEMEGISWGADGFKGLKDHYEDRFDARFLGGLGHFFAMFDGHGGHHAADYLKESLADHVLGAAVARTPDYRSRLDARRHDAKRRRLEQDGAAAPTHGADALGGPHRGRGPRGRRARQGPEERELRLAGARGDRRRPRDAAPVARQGVEEAAAAGRGGGATSSAAADRERARADAADAAAARATLPLTDDAWRRAFCGGYEAADAAFLAEADRRNWDDGSTACACLLSVDDEAGSRKLVVANAGDSRCVLARGRHAFRASTDHKPDAPAEKRRIEKVGGYVVELNGVARATSPAGVGFGIDRTKKSLYLSDDDLFVVLVCDGVTDVLSDQQIVDVAAKHYGDPAEAAKKIVKEAFAKQAADNITALVLEFPWVDAAKVGRVWAESEKQLKVALQEKKDDEPFDMFA
ncbi:protein serine/threonine phosphatase [Aureococcus anophagefferens]|nr:protein serine/threonine phosphatase [Aureococcus anophagefferens]